MGRRPPVGFGVSAMRTSATESGHSPRHAHTNKIRRKAANSVSGSRSRARGCKLSQARPVVSGNARMGPLQNANMHHREL